MNSSQRDWKPDFERQFRPTAEQEYANEVSTTGQTLGYSWLLMATATVFFGLGTLFGAML
jgi:hypothetical protein